MLTATNQKTGEVQPAAIGVLGSPVAIGVLVSMVFKAAALFFPGYVPLGMEEAATQLVLGGISLAADAFALYKRWFSQLQPIKIGGPTVVPVLLAFLLVGCAGNREELDPSVPPPIVQTRYDQAVGSGSAQLAQYCQWLRFGAWVGSNFARTAEHKRYTAQAQAAVVRFCDRPPTDIASALEYLGRAYRDVMAVPAVRVAIEEARLKGTR